MRINIFIHQTWIPCEALSGFTLCWSFTLSSPAVVLLCLLHAALGSEYNWDGPVRVALAPDPNANNGEEPLEHSECVCVYSHLQVYSCAFVFSMRLGRVLLWLLRDAAKGEHDEDVL